MFFSYSISVYHIWSDRIVINKSLLNNLDHLRDKQIL